MNMRKGFTLVELLIVIVIIGILAAAMLLSTGSATAAARASTIISDMRGIKSACLMYYADHMDDIDGMTAALAGDLGTAFAKYIDNAEKFKGDKSPAKIEITDDGKWWIHYTVEADAEVQEKLKGKAAADGLYAGKDATGDTYESGADVYMVAR